MAHEEVVKGVISRLERKKVFSTEELHKLKSTISQPGLDLAERLERLMREFHGINQTGQN